MCRAKENFLFWQERKGLGVNVRQIIAEGKGREINWR
jgi:hypothetical protein